MIHGWVHISSLDRPASAISHALNVGTLSIVTSPVEKPGKRRKRRR